MYGFVSPVPIFTKQPLWASSPLCRRMPRMLASSPPPSSSVKPLQAKRLCVFSDGTWNTPEVESLTNVSVLAKSVEYSGPSGVPQIVFYDEGVGTEGGTVDQLLGGAIGKGLDLNIKQLYTFLVMNYNEGDEIYMFGFSRGAYTVRSLAGMMYDSGLLYRNKLDYVKEAYDLYRENVNAESERARAFRAKHGRRVPIKLLSCFDTVGALGIPDYVPFPFSLFKNTAKYRFHDTTLNEYIENAIHVLSLDEELVPFEPTLMTANKKVGEKQLTQIYMPGRHGGVGGGNFREEPLARNALKFVLEEMEHRNLKLDVTTGDLPDKYRTDCAPGGRAPLFSLFGVVGLTTGLRSRIVASFDMLHPTVKEIYRKNDNWRPGSLEPFKEELEM